MKTLTLIFWLVVTFRSMAEIEVGYPPELAKVDQIQFVIEEGEQLRHVSLYEEGEWLDKKLVENRPKGVAWMLFVWKEDDAKQLFQVRDGKVLVFAVQWGKTFSFAIPITEFLDGAGLRYKEK